MKHPLLVPSPLKKGDCIGIAAPAGQLPDTAKFEQGVTILRDMGFEPLFPRELWPGTGYLADSDANRAKELMDLFANPDIKGIIAARGGYGCLRLLPYLDFEHIRKNIKPVIGFSDLTVLLNQFLLQSRCVSFHGPVVTSLPEQSLESLERFYHALAGNFSVPIAANSLEILRGGDEVKGPLVGGNLCSLLTMIGTGFDIDLSGAILFIEDVNEPLFKIDRMLTQLWMSGKAEGIRGLILGDFSTEDDYDKLLKLRYTEAIWERVLELCSHSSFPVWGNFPVGHFSENITLPIGLEATMDSRQAKLFIS